MKKIFIYSSIVILIFISEYSEAKDIYISPQHTEVTVRGNKDHWSECGECAAVTGALYLDDNGLKEDDAVIYMRCTKYYIGNDTAFKITNTSDVKLNTGTTRWFYCPENTVMVSAHWDSDKKDSSVDCIRCGTLTSTNTNYTIKLTNEHRNIILNTGTTGWHYCPDGFIITGVHYYDDDTNPDDSIEEIRCTRISIESN